MPYSTVSIPALPTTVLAGLAVDSSNAGATSTAQFDTVRLGSLSWNPGVTALPAALFDAPAATGADGRVYVFGGTDGTGDSRTTYIYTPATDGWTIGASLPTTHTAGQAVALPNGDIAVIGGATGCGGSYGLPCSGGAVSKGVDVYTPSADAWNLAGHTLPALTTARQRFAAVLYQGSLYVLGGATTSATLASVETYNLAAHPAAWSAGPSLPLPRWA